MTVIKDAAGRYVYSFVVDTDPEQTPPVTPEVGADLGLDDQFQGVPAETRTRASKIVL
ncbi:hypothetical protein [Streptomyces sp. NPDC002758]